MDPRPDTTAMKLFSPKTLAYFYMSRAAPCPYIPGQTEQMIFTDLSSAELPADLHDRLSRSGFRRSQGIVYKPNCPACSACVPVRIDVARFDPSKSLRRVRRRNRDVSAKQLPAVALIEHFDLFADYVQSRHGDGGMANMGFDDYMSMVQDTPIQTRLMEYRDDANKLYGVCVTDLLEDGLSLVYSFFDQHRAGDSPGTYIILQHIEEARRRGLPHVYLGYWIKESRKMAYKSRFKGAQMFGPDGWRDVRLDESAED